MKVLTIMLISLLNVIPSGKAFLRPVTERDSILVGDRLEYGFHIDDLPSDAVLFLPEFNGPSSDTIILTRSWKLDTLSRGKRGKIDPAKPLTVEGTMEFTSFEPGRYVLPPIPVGKLQGNRMDTLIFEPVEFEMMQIPIDTNTYVIKDIKDQMTYPLTFSEVFPYVAFPLLGLVLVAALVWFLKKKRREKESEAHKDPPHIVALRKLDHYRGDKYWAPDKQKIFYSGITDALKEYIDSRYGIDAPEMTTDELFRALKKSSELTPEMYGDLKKMFETADFVKFAKYHADDTTNAGALPLAVRFVTTTYLPAEEEAAPEK